MYLFKLVVLFLFVFLNQSFSVASTSILDSGMSARQIAEGILRDARKKQAMAAKEKVNVVMYSTSWCGYCKKARRYFKSKGIKYTEYDIERSTAAKWKYDRLGGKGVPLILIGNNRMRGFSVRRFDRLYEKSR